MDEIDIKSSLSLTIFVLLLAVAFVAIVFHLYYARPSLMVDTVNSVEGINAEALDIMGFPLLPLGEDRFIIIKSERVTSPDGKVQFTKVATSQREVTDNFTHFKNFFLAKGGDWTIVLEVNDQENAKHKAIFATNKDGLLTLNITLPVGQTTGSIVTFDFLLNNKPN